jgi:hypothetical protein
LSRTASMMASMAANRRNPATPLPIRILTTVLYQMVRLPYVWQWCVSPTGSLDGGTVYSAIETRKGKHVEWFFYGPLTHLICKP